MKPLSKPLFLALLAILVVGVSAFFIHDTDPEIQVEYGGEVSSQSYDTLKAEPNDNKITITMWNTLLDFIETETVDGEVDTTFDWMSLKLDDQRERLTAGMWNTLLEELKNLHCTSFDWSHLRSNDRLTAGRWNTLLAELKKLDCTPDVTVSFNSNGGGSVLPKTVTYGSTYGELLPSAKA
jgi:hypothetical protein